MNKKIGRVFLLLVLMLSLTGCTKTLTDVDKKGVKNPVTGQTLTENILCKPTDKDTIKVYKENKVDIDKLPACHDMKVTTGGYEGLWTNIFVKPLAWFIIQVGNVVGNYGLALILTSLLIRFIVLPLTRKSAMQSELLKEAQKDLNRIEKKYANKNDQESLMKKSQEMTMVYKKHGINPMAGCLVAFIQLPLFIAFFEAINRVPALFEDHFLGLQLGTTPWIGTSSGNILYNLLNNTSKYLKTNLLVNKTEDYGRYSGKITYQGKKTGNKNKLKVNLPSMYDLFSTTIFEDYWYKEYNKDNYCYMYYQGRVECRNYNYSDIKGIRPVVFLNKNVTIKKGTGLEQNPYEIAK